jgi:hypothetical protein
MTSSLSGGLAVSASSAWQFTGTPMVRGRVPRNGARTVNVDDDG